MGQRVTFSLSSCTAAPGLGPLLGANDTVSVHCIVDGAYVQCIFNNLTAITAMVSPTADATELVEFFGSAVATLLQLESWRLALPND